MPKIKLSEITRQWKSTLKETYYNSHQIIPNKIDFSCIINDAVTIFIYWRLMRLFFAHNQIVINTEQRQQLASSSIYLPLRPFFLVYCKNSVFFLETYQIANNRMIPSKRTNIVPPRMKTTVRVLATPSTSPFPCSRVARLSLTSTPSRLRT